MISGIIHASFHLLQNFFWHLNPPIPSAYLYLIDLHPDLGRGLRFTRLRRVYPPQEGSPSGVLYSGCQKNVPLSERFFLQPLIPSFCILELIFEKWYQFARRATGIISGHVGRILSASFERAKRVGGYYRKWNQNSYLSTRSN